MKKYLAEALGTFALVLVGTGAILADELSNGQVTHVGVSLAFGLVVMAVIFAIGDVSGAHINPAVTIAFWMAGRASRRDILPYIGCQLFGASMASVLLKILFFEHDSPSGFGSTLPSGEWWQAFVLETLLTFILMFVILSVSDGSRERGIPAGIAVGGVVAMSALFAGPLSGASMNPARSLGPALVSESPGSLWIYLVAPVIGASLAVPFCRCTRGKPCCSLTVPGEQAPSGTA